MNGVSNILYLIYIYLSMNVQIIFSDAPYRNKRFPKISNNLVLICVSGFVHNAHLIRLVPKRQVS